MVPETTAQEGIAMRYYFLALGALVVVCTGCAGIDTSGSGILADKNYVAPPSSMMARPGPMVDGPGPGVLGMAPMPGAGMGPMGPSMQGPPLSTQVRFIGDAIDGCLVGWQAGAVFADNQLTVPAAYDFHQSAVYQLKLSDIPGAEGVDLYPTLEVRAAHPTTLAYLQHNAIPLEITEEDLQHVNGSNMVTKVIYLPDPDFQSRAIQGVETLVSTRLEPGIDPVQQAEQMGTIMLILRFGNKNLQPAASVMAPDGSIAPVAYHSYDGNADEMAPPIPIRFIQQAGNGVPNAMIAAGGGFPGQPSMPVAGMGAMQPWGMPITATPFGLPGPPHLPYGGKAGLKSHTIRNLTKVDIPEPEEHLLYDVKHKPGYRLPQTPSHIKYTETNPVFRPGEVAIPAGGSAYGPPGMF